MTRVDGLYLQVNFVCLLVILRLWRTVFKDYISQYEGRLFSHVLLSTAILIFADMGWILFSTLLFPGNITVNYLVNTIYFLSSAFIGVTWVVFCEYVIGAGLFKNKILAFILHIPFLALLILTLLSPIFHFIFYIDSGNAYHRGPFHFLQVFCMNIYFIITGIQGIIKIFDRNDLAQKKKYISISTMMLFAFLAQIIQVLIPGYPTMEIGLTIALLSVFIEMRNSIISIDPLTQINNRSQLLRFITQKFKSRKDDDDSKNLYLMVLDVDSFKEINDRFGHLEGDEALKIVANSLKKVASQNNYFICRYGGDEFVVVCEKENDNEVKLLRKEIQDTVAELSIEKKKKYVLSVSVGYAKRENSKTTAADLIKKADEFMYKNKKARKQKAKSSR